MPLKVIQVQDWDGNFSYAPPLRDAVVNTDEIVSAQPCESRGIGPFMRINFRDGSHKIAKGEPKDLLE